MIQKDHNKLQYKFYRIKENNSITKKIIKYSQYKKLFLIEILVDLYEISNCPKEKKRKKRNTKNDKYLQIRCGENNCFHLRRRSRRDDKS